METLRTCTHLCMSCSIRAREKIIHVDVTRFPHFIALVEVYFDFSFDLCLVKENPLFSTLIFSVFDLQIDTTSSALLLEHIGFSEAY